VEAVEEREAVDDDASQTPRLQHSQQLARTAAAADKDDDDDVGKENAKPTLRWTETAGRLDLLLTDAVGSV